MLNDYKNIYCLHAIDDTTNFLTPFKELSEANYIPIEANANSVNNALEQIKAFEQVSLIIFLGHGQSGGLYSPESQDFSKQIMINSEIGNRLFENQDVILLCCRSSDYIHKLNTYRNIIGFGNILSSLGEVSIEADYSGHFRQLFQEDIDYYNSCYTKAIVNSVKLLMNNQIIFTVLVNYIEYYINKGINVILRNKNKPNRIELAKLLFEFKNEMTFKNTVKDQ